MRLVVKLALETNMSANAINDIAESQNLSLSTIGVFNRSSSSIELCLSPMVVFYQRPSSSQFAFHLYLKVVFHLRSPNIKGCLQSKVVLYRRSSSTNDCQTNHGKIHFQAFFKKPESNIEATFLNLFEHSNHFCKWLFWILAIKIHSTGQDSKGVGRL